MARESSRVSFFAMLAVVAAIVVPGACGEPDRCEPPMFRWEQTDHSLALLNGEKIVWRFNFPDKGKPYFYPLNLRDGTELVCDSPSDHPAHRGLWFSWKNINNRDNWGENRDDPSRTACTTVRRTMVKLRDDFSAEVVLFLRYDLPDQTQVLSETRIVEIEKPDEVGAYWIWWSSSFHAGIHDVTLDDMPTGTESESREQAKYAGLSFRMAEGITDCQVADGREWLDVEGRFAHRVCLTGKTSNKSDVAIVVFDSLGGECPKNPWVMTTGSQVSSCCFSQALLSAKTMTIPAGNRQTFAYCILVHPGTVDDALMGREWDHRILWPVRRMKLGKRLADLGKTLLIYAADHEDRFPSSLHLLQGSQMTAEQLQWWQDNVEYRGAGMTTNCTPANAVVAYDKTLLKDGWGTNVLFVDSHVQLVEPAKLAAFGIGLETRK